MVMTSFQGSLKIAATADVIDAEFSVDEDRFAVQTGDDQLGSWSIADLHLERRGDGLHAVLDGEDVVLNVPDMDSFLSVIAPPKAGRKRSKRAKKPPSASGFVTTAPQEKKARKEPRDRTSLLTKMAGAKQVFSAENWRGWLSDTTIRWVIASATVASLALLALFATGSLGMILVLVGMIALIIAALAVSDDLSAFGWVPGNLSETTLVISGAVAMVLGGVLILVG